MATTNRIRSKHLTCSICFEFYTRPKTLPCMHSFCEHCLENHIVTKKTEKGFVCPMCNNFTLMPDPKTPVEQWVTQFKTDFKLTGMLEEMNLIEEEKKLKTDVSQLDTMIDELRGHESSLLEMIDRDRLTLSRVSQQQETVSQQITDVFTTIKLKLQRKEEAVREKLHQVSSQKKDVVSRGWLGKQKLVDQVNALIEEAERVQASDVSDDTVSEMLKLRTWNGQVVKSVNNVRDIIPSKVELSIKQEDIVKLDMLSFCDVGGPTKSQAPTPPTQKTGPPTDPKPGKTEDPQSKIQPSSVTIRQGVQAHNATDVPKRREVVATITPVKTENDREPDFQDIVVVRESGVQILVLADYNNMKVVAIYVKQGSKTQKNLKLDGHPARLCKLDSKTIGVSVNDPYKVVIISVYPELKQVNTIKTNINNIGITALRANTLAVSCKDKIDVMTTTGTLITEFKIKVASSYYAMSWYMSTTPTGSIIVSDRYGEVVSCVTPTGQTLWQWNPPDSTPPAGVACDQQGRIYVVLMGKKEVHQLSETGQFKGVVLTENEDLVVPTAMDIDQFGQWYVLKRSRQIQVFKQ